MRSTPFFFAAMIIFLAAPAFSQSSSVPAASTDKALSTPDFYQKDPRGGFTDNGGMYCGPVAVSDAFMYFGAHGYPNLSPSDAQTADQAQIEMINTLASDNYLHTVSLITSVAAFLYGVRKYVEDHGYICKRLEYEGGGNLPPRFAPYKMGSQPQIDWIKGALANPNGFAWLFVRRSVAGASPGQWIDQGGHIVAVVGYGPGPTLLVHNPNRESFRPPAQSLADDEITLTPLTQGTFYPFHGPQPFPVTGYNIASGPGLPLPPRVDNYILLGAVVLVIAKPPPDTPAERAPGTTP